MPPPAKRKNMCVVVVVVVVVGFDAAPHATADKSFARFRSYIPA
jgi:hypothetical protein